MSKKKLLISLVVIATLINTILYRDPGLISFLLTACFYFLLLLFYRKTKYIVVFSIAMIISVFGYNMLFFPPIVEIFGLSIIRTLMAFSFFGALFTILAGFSIILKNETSKIVEVSLFSFALVNLFLFSLYTLHFHKSMIRFFGPYEADLLLMWEIYYLIEGLVLLMVGIFQVTILYLIDLKELKLQCVAK